MYERHLPFDKPLFVLGSIERNLNINTWTLSVEKKLAILLVTFLGWWVHVFRTQWLWTWPPTKGIKRSLWITWYIIFTGSAHRLIYRLLAVSQTAPLDKPKRWRNWNGACEKGNNGTHSLIKGSGPFFFRCHVSFREGSYGWFLWEETYIQAMAHQHGWICQEYCNPRSTFEVILHDLSAHSLNKSGQIIQEYCRKHTMQPAFVGGNGRYAGNPRVLPRTFIEVQCGIPWREISGLQPLEFLGSKLSNTVSGIPTDSKNIYTQMLNVWYIYQHLGSLVGKCR